MVTTAVNADLRTGRSNLGFVFLAQFGAGQLHSLEIMVKNVVRKLQTRWHELMPYDFQLFCNDWWKPLLQT